MTGGGSAAFRRAVAVRPLMMSATSARRGPFMACLRESGAPIKPRVGGRVHGFPDSDADPGLQSHNHPRRPPMPATLPPLSVTRRRFLGSLAAAAGVVVVRPTFAADADPHRVAFLSDTHIPELPATVNNGCNM